jgi:ketosteroid isomerase-like protein
MANDSSSTSSVAARLRDALVSLTPDRPEAIDALRALYADDMVFRDPIQEVRGIDAFLAMNRRLLHRMRTLEWTVETARGDDDEVFLEWTMTGKAKLGPMLRVHGVTRARARDGRIYDHRDYWDLGELIASSLPGGQRILYALRSPLA